MGNNPSDLLPEGGGSSSKARLSASSEDIYVSRQFDQRHQLSAEHLRRARSFDPQDENVTLSTDPDSSPASSGSLEIPTFPRPMGSASTTQLPPRRLSKVRRDRNHNSSSITASSAVFLKDKNLGEYINNSNSGVERKRMTPASPSAADYSGSINDDVLEITQPGMAAFATHHVASAFKRRGDKWMSQLNIAQTRARYAPDLYEKLLTQDSPFHNKIHRDICRTFPNHEFFRDSKASQETLFRIVTAYSIYDSTVGYSQGIAFIAGFLYLHMSEVNAFWTMVELMYGKKYNLRELFDGNSEALLYSLKEFETQFERLIPDLYAHFKKLGIEASMFAAQWVLTVFIYRFPAQYQETLPLIWERFVDEGIVSVYQIGIALLSFFREGLLKMEFQEEILSFFNPLQAFPPEIVTMSVEVDFSSHDFKYMGRFYGADKEDV